MRILAFLPPALFHSTYVCVCVGAATPVASAATVVVVGAESSRLASIFQTPLGKCAKWLLTNTFA